MRRSPATIAFLLIVAGVLCAGLVALGVFAATLVQLRSRPKKSPL